MAENNFSLQKTLTMLLDEKKYHSLRDILSTMNPADIAAIFDDLDQARLPLLFRLLPKELAAETFVEMEPEAQELLIQGFSDSELKEVIDELYVDDAVDIVEEMPANVVQRILTQAEPDMRKQINEILRYPEDSAGSIMTTEYVSLRPNMTVEEAILRIRRTGIDKETIYTCYVTRGHKLIGLTSVKDLLLCEDDDATIESIMQEHVITVGTLDDKEQVAQMFSKYNFLALPVVDTENRLVGIVTFDDAMDVMEDEATEDMEKMAAMLPSEHPYMRSTPVEIWKNRIPWLLLLMVSATLTGIVITRFENSLAALPCLTAFIPMLMDTGGNSGSQACVSIIRGISLNEIEFRDLGRVVWKEIRVSVLCGVCLAIACFAKIIVVDMLLLKSESVTYLVAFVVCATMAVTVCLAKIVGSTLPLLAKKPVGAAHARRLPGLLQKISVSALWSILLGGVRIDAHQLLRDAEGGLQKRDRVLRQPLRLRVQRRDLRQERLEPEGLRSGVLRAGDELCRGDIEAFGDLFNGIRPQAVFSFQIALKCRARNAELFGKFQLAFLLRFHPVPQCGCNVFLYLHKATSLNKKIRTWVQLVNASLPAKRPAFRQLPGMNMD